MMNVQTAKQVFVATDFNKTLGSMDKLEELGFEFKNWEESNSFIKEASNLYNPLDEAKVGDGVTVHYYSDAKAGTVIARTNKTLTIQLDTSTLLNRDELEFVSGGFSAHCVNQRDQKYSYKANAEGEVMKISRRKNGEYKVQKSDSRVSVGRGTFHDFNF
jgi:hypothetical protein